MGGFNLPRKIRRVGIKHLWQIAGIQKEKQEIRKKMLEIYLKNRKV